MDGVDVIGALAVVFALVVVIVVGALVVFALRGGNGHRSPLRPYALFLLGVSLVSVVALVVSAGIATHAVANLVGPSPLPADSAIEASTPAPPTGSLVPSIDGGHSVSYPSDQTDQRNHDITRAVIAGMFGLSAGVGYLVAWRRSRRLFDPVDADAVGLGRLPLGYAYFMAGLGALAVLGFVPASAAALFRALAPGVNGTSGHADGLRKLATFAVVAGLSAWVMAGHLRIARRLREAANGHEAGPSLPGESPPS